MAVKLLLISCLSALTAAITTPSTDPSAYSSDCIITRDVAVIGGGSSGTYAAIGLRDRGKTVAVVEAQSVFGGHTNTYTDPSTNATVDYGVIEWDNTTIVTSYFARFGIPLILASSAPPPGLKDLYVDFRTGKTVAGYTPKDPTAAFGLYAAQLAKYPFLNTPGWDLPDPVPSDLLIPFGDFITKYKVDDAVFTINQYAQGFGDLLTTPTLYVLKYFSQAVLAGSQTGFLTTARHDNSEIYEKARAELGDDAFVNSKVLVTDRSGSDVKAVIQTPQGIKLIIAQKLVITAPPLISNLAGFDLSSNERTLFSQFTNGAYYTALLRNTGIPDDISITGVGADTPYNLPTNPSIYNSDPTGVKGLVDVKFVGAVDLSDSAAQATILSNIQELKTVGTIQSTTSPDTTPEFAAYNSHTPYELRVSADAIAEGFYKNLTALQGQRHTYYTGAAFNKHDSGDLWAFTAGLLPQIAA